MIRCAAILMHGTEMVISMPRPARHHTILHALYAEGMSPGHGEHTQGFLNDSGEFVTREQAFALTGKGRNGQTFSEDLW
jgi:hypothetical protein